MSFFIRNSRQNHLDSLDGIRAFSILFVITFHAFFFSQYAFENIEAFLHFSNNLPWYLSWVRRGDLGVDIFFVLSAFLIGSQLFCEEQDKHRISLRRFYLKRFLRIYPIYIFALLLFGLKKGWDNDMLGNLFAYNNLWNIEDIVIPWSWSLSVEIQFYAVFPILLITIRQHWLGALLCALLLLASVFWMSHFYFRADFLQNSTMMDFIVHNRKDEAIYYMQYLYVSPLARVPAFVFGVLAAWCWVYRRDCLITHFEAHRRLYAALTCLVFLSCLALGSFNIYQPFADLSAGEKIVYTLNMLGGRLLFALLISVLLLVSLLPKNCGSFTRHLLSHPLLYPIARGSYSMYLFHPYLLFAAYFVLFGEEKLESLSTGGLFSLALLGIVFAFAFSFLSYHLIEKWFSYGRVKGWISKVKKSKKM